MVENSEVLRSKFLKAYASVPEKMREEIIAVISDNPYSWYSAFIEIHGKTKLGNQILEKLDEINLFKSD